MTCSFRVNLRNFWYRDSMADHIEPVGWSGYQPKTRTGAEFCKQLKEKLDALSSNDSTWAIGDMNPHQELRVVLFTKDDNFSMRVFKDKVQKEILPMFNNIEVFGRKLAYFEKYKLTEFNISA